MKPKPITLNDIIDGCKAGRNDAFEALVDRYSKRFYGYFFSQTFDGQVSDDLLGEFYLKIVKSVKTFKDGSFEAWMQKIAVNVYYDYLRKHIRDRDNSIKYCEEKAYLDTCSPDQEPCGQTDAAEKLKKAVAQLDEDSRELVLMRYFSDMSFKEIAEATGKPIGTVLAKVHRSIAKLKEIMEVVR